MITIKHRRRPGWILPAVILVPIVGGYVFYRWWNHGGGQRASLVFAWFRDGSLFPEKMMRAGQRCGEAPFLFPTDGLVGFLWDDAFRLGHRHQGIDIFAGGPVGQTPVVAAYAGYLTRLPEWRSAVIIRIPEDPLQPGRQIWTYYTHMADAGGASFISANFPAGTLEKYVTAGSLLGYQGNYSGNADNPTGVHLHFSIVRDDGRGRFANELEIANTIDPSPYLGMQLNGRTNPDEIPVCPAAAVD